MKDKIANIQALRGAAALSVFAAHLVGAETDYGGPEPLLPNWLHIGLTGVDLFFVISGYVMAHVTHAMPRTKNGAARFLYNRMARIYPLYWLVTLGMIVMFAFKKNLFHEDTALANPVTSMLLLPNTEHPILAVGWTLIHEMYFYFVFAVFLLFQARRLNLLLGLWALVIALSTISGIWKENPWFGVLLNPLTFEFIAGVIIAKIIQRGFFKFAMPALLIGVSGLVFLTIFSFDQLYPGAMVDLTVRTAIFGPLYALILYGAVALEQKSSRKAPDWLMKTGDASYALYLVHIPIFLVVGKSLSLTGASGVIYQLTLIATYTAVTLAMAFIAHHYFEKPALRFTKSFGTKLFLSRA